MRDGAPFLRAVVLDRGAIDDPDAHPFTLPVVRALDRLELPTPVTLIVGENGSGKSTLMEALAASLGLNPEGGTQNFAFATRASHSALHAALRPVRGARRPRTVVLPARRELLQRRHGDRAARRPARGRRLAAARRSPRLRRAPAARAVPRRVVPGAPQPPLRAATGSTCSTSPRPRCRRRGCSPSSRGSGAGRARARSSSSPPTRRCCSPTPARPIYEIQDGALVPTPYEDTDHVRLTRSFLEDPERFLRLL